MRAWRAANDNRGKLVEAFLDDLDPLLALIFPVIRSHNPAKEAELIGRVTVMRRKLKAILDGE